MATKLRRIFSIRLYRLEETRLGTWSGEAHSFASNISQTFGHILQAVLLTKEVARVVEKRELGSREPTFRLVPSRRQSSECHIACTRVRQRGDIQGYPGWGACITGLLASVSLAIHTYIAPRWGEQS